MLKLCNSLFNCQYRNDPNAVYLLIHLICRALEAEMIDGTDSPGVIKTSIAKLSLSANLTARKTRTALKKLCTAGVVTSQATKCGREITIENYRELTTPFSIGDKVDDKRKRLLAKAGLMLEDITSRPDYCDKRGKLVVELPLNQGGIRTPKVHFFGGQ